MKRCSFVGFCLSLHFASSAFSSEPSTHTESGVDIEQRKFVVRVVSYDMQSAVMDAIPIEDTVHLDCLVFDILAPEDQKGKRWHLFIHNQVWSPPIDYGYRRGDVLEIDVPRFGITKRQLAEMMASTEWMGSVWIQNELIRGSNQTPDRTPRSRRRSRELHRRLESTEGVGQRGRSAVMKRIVPLVVLSIGFFLCSCTKTNPAAKTPEVTVVLDGTSSIAEAIPCTSSFLKPRGASPLLGRDFVPDDFQGSSPAVAMLGTVVWRSAFGARPDIIGRTVQIGGQDFVVVGVAPDEPAELGGRKVWLATKS